MSYINKIGGVPEKNGCSTNFVLFIQIQNLNIPILSYIPLHNIPAYFCRNFFILKYFSLSRPIMTNYSFVGVYNVYINKEKGIKNESNGLYRSILYDKFQHGFSVLFSEQSAT